MEGDTPEGPFEAENAAREAKENFALGCEQSLEFYDCNPAVLASPERLEAVLRSALAPVKPVAVMFKAVSGGVAGSVITSGAALSIETFPEQEYLAATYFNRGNSETPDFNTINDRLSKSLSCGKFLISSWNNRGIGDTEGVEELVPVLQDMEGKALQLSWKERFDRSGAQAVSAAVDLFECSALEAEPDDLEGVINEFCAALLSELELPGEDAGCSCVPVDGECWKFDYPLEIGTLNGFFYPSRQTLYLNLMVNGFFDPRRTAEVALAAIGGSYYHLQVSVRQ